MGDDFNPTLAEAFRQHAVVICGSSDYVKQGATIAVEERSGKPKIIINAKAAKKSGLRLAPKVLAFAIVIE